MYANNLTLGSHVFVLKTCPFITLITTLISLITKVVHSLFRCMPTVSDYKSP